MIIKNIVVAGAGTMGYSIAQILAKYDFQVIIYDLKESVLQKARHHIEQNIEILISENEMSLEESQALLNNIVYTTQKDCFKICDFVIESIVENIDIKKSFYQEISNIVKDECILATNTSGISINTLSESVCKPERFIGMHWFNPCHLIMLIEIIKGQYTSDNIADIVYQLSLKIQKKPVIVEKDVLGFAANRIQFAVLREALWLVEQGVISKTGIDDIMKYGLGFRYACLGPLEIADFGGIDTFYHICDYLMEDLCDSHEVPNEIKKLYEESHYGVKTLSGFYDYHNGKDSTAKKQRDEKLLKVYNALYNVTE